MEDHIAKVTEFVHGFNAKLWQFEVCSNNRMIYMFTIHVAITGGGLAPHFIDIKWAVQPPLVYNLRGFEENTSCIKWGGPTCATCHHVLEIYYEMRRDTYILHLSETGD